MTHTMTKFFMTWPWTLKNLLPAKGIANRKTNTVSMSIQDVSKRSIEKIKMKG